MKKLLLSFILITLFMQISPKTVFAEDIFWEIQSIDTMKYSRDLARQNMRSAAFAGTIDETAKKISETGATHMAIGTPYDNEFRPYLLSWINAARKYNLKVWFRGNFSGWEGWFNYAKISPDEHKRKLATFIELNPELFMAGDILTPCPECENGGPGDPRETKDIKGFRNFLIEERELCISSFEKIGKEVTCGYFSMNGDVAKLIMDPRTTEKLGGVVVVDHYVANPETLSSDIIKISELSRGDVVLGEFGAPIPDIHGAMTEAEQDKWLKDTLTLLSKNNRLIGINYWVADGGTTAIFNGEKRRLAAETLTLFFKPDHINATVINEIEDPIEGAVITHDNREAETDKEGKFEIEISPSTDTIKIVKDGFREITVKIENGNIQERILLEKEKEGLIWKIQKFFHDLFS